MVQVSHGPGAIRMRCDKLQRWFGLACRMSLPIIAALELDRRHTPTGDLASSE